MFQWNRTPSRPHPASEDRKDPVEAVGPDMRPRVVEDVGGRAAGDQFLQAGHFERIVHTRIQLAVGVGAGAALTKQEVGLGVRHAAVVEVGDVGGPLFQLRTAVDQVDADAVDAQDQRGV